MFCRHCGAKISDEAVFCTACGERVARQTTVSETKEDASFAQNAESVKNEESVVDTGSGEGAQSEETQVSKEEPTQKTEEKTEEAKEEEAKTEEAKKEEAKTEEAKKEETKTEEAKEEETKIEEEKAEEAKTEEAKTEEERAEEAKTEETKAEEAKTEETKTEETKTEAAKTEEDQSGEEKKKKKKEKKEKTKKGKAACVALSVLACILVVILGVYAETIFLVRSATSKDAVADLVKNLDVSEMKINFGGQEGDTLTDYVVGQAGGVFKDYITKAKVRKLLKQEFVSEFLEEKINDYVGDLFGNNGKGVVEVQEVRKLLERNDETIFEILDPEMKTYFPGDPYEYLEEELERHGTLDMTDLSRYRTEQPLVFSLIRYLLSYWMLALLLVLILALAVGIFMLQQRRIKGFGYMGVSLFIIGIVSLTVSFMTGIIASWLEQGIGFESEFWQQILAPVRTKGLMAGIILAASGVVFYVIHVIGKAVQKKKAGVSAEMPVETPVETQPPQE